MKRKDFIKSSIYLGASIPLLGCIKNKNQEGQHVISWNQGDVVHILPTVNHNRILVSTSFKRSVNVPHLKVGNRVVRGQKRDSSGYFWIFDCSDLESNTSYTLRLYEKDEALCDAWPLKTFPGPNADSEEMKLLVYTCAGGHPEAVKFYPMPDKETPTGFAERRIGLLKRGLSFQPDAMIVIGDNVYWDLSGNGKNRPGFMEDPRALEVAPRFDKSKPVLGTENEAVLKQVVNPQIADLYGTSCRSTPVFFFNDDHDYFENDEANDAIITFPPKPFQLELARAVQKLYTPEFLPDEKRPLDLPGSSAGDRVEGASEAFGTLRYGRLAEFLMYDCRRFLTLDGQAGQFIPQETERWLYDRTTSQEVKHTFHVPSTPFGWSAGKWGEWYADILGPDRRLRDDLEKPYWQQGWKLQHDRILQKMHEAKHKKAIMISGDLHAFASGRIYRNENLDYSTNPINCLLSGPLGNNVFPSTFRKIKASTPNALGVEEDFENYEENGFSIVEIDRLDVRVKMYKYLWTRDSIEEINQLEPFYNSRV